MKIIFQTLVILVVATLIGGAIFAAVNSTSSSAQSTAFERSDDEGGRPPRPEGEEFEGGIMLPFGMVKTLAVISVIAAVYLNAGKLFGKGRASKPVNM